jgi:ectoine hydroxylase-related dioxygenase (phytanoyl-CoA dioxygenase family)
VNDPVINSLVRFYLRTAIQVRHVSLWHSFPAVNFQPESELAQLFHFDLDEFRWLKLFIFLTDVDLENGPHVYIPGTHKPGSKSSELLKRGYSRITDDDMELYHPRSTWREILCEAGTMVLADTRCWHKGAPVLDGVRSVLQPEYAPSSFSKEFL